MQHPIIYSILISVYLIIYCITRYYFGDNICTEVFLDALVLIIVVNTVEKT